jgi:uncharacterized protein (UPF0332 family)
MNQEAHDLWLRAVRSYKTASKLVKEDPDAAASRAYYAAFYAVSGLFALQGKTFTQHRAVEAAVHRDLVQAKTWSVDLGASFSWLVRLRRTGDYGGSMHVSPDEAKEAVDKARSILQAVRTVSPESLPPIEEAL